MQALRTLHRKVFIVAGLLLAMPLFCSHVAAAGDGPEIVVQLEPQDIFLGESATYQVQVRNLKNVVRPDMTNFEKDFTVKEAGDQSQNSTSINWINGNVTQRTVYAHLYQYALTPKRAGVLTVPAPFVLVDGQKISGVPSQLTVRAEEKQDIAICEVSASRLYVYPTQPFDVTLRVLIRPTPTLETRDPLSLIDPVDLQLDWADTPSGLTSLDMSHWLSPLRTTTGHGFGVNNLSAQDDSPFSMFESRRAVFSLNVPNRERRNGLDGKPIDYFVYELKRTFTPEKTGTYTFGGTLKGTFVDSVTGRNYKPRRLVITAVPAKVEVRDVPAPVPPTYCGALGNYKLAARANPIALRVGDPLTLKLEFERGKGGGSLDLISAPDISVNPQIASDFEVIDKTPTGEVSGSTKTFSYGLRPKRAGVTLPALTVSLFNVDTEKYSELSTDPIVLKVTQSAQIGAADLISAGGARANDIKNRQGGVVQNFQDITALQDQSANPLLYSLAAIAVWIVCGAASLLVTRRRQLANDAAWQRRNRARPDAEQNLKLAREATDTAAAGRFVRAAIVGMIGDMLDLPAAGMTSQEAKSALVAANVSEATRKSTVELLESIEALEYAPSAGQSISGMIEVASKLVAELQRELSQ